ncbi:hypothetical protein CJ030_MR5G025117 [Morella rubra]|uniref:Putative plant transposon protein domain-containing protein n=1 Tax=Morella rubra TaxID=262757 RepID=A0A6A1VHL2_9ROSI|nr:hypothetical protein CJ030_MR5G025117 [Morella rubra]
MESSSHHLSPPPASVVKEFYTNFFNIHDSCFSTYIRGQVIEISPPFLAEKLGIPFVKNPQYPYPSSTRPPLSTIVSFLMKRTIRGFSRKEFPGKFLATDHVIPARIIFTNIFPNIHMSSFSFERIRFLYAVLNNDSIDLATNICDHMIDIFRSNSGNLKLRYGCLIMLLLSRLGITFPLSETRLGPLKTIGKDTIKQSESHKRQNPQRHPSDVPDLTDAIKLLLDRSSAIQSALITLQSDMAVTRLELSQVRADIKLLQPLF